MGFRLLIDGNAYELQGFSVQEAATPLAAGDSSGQVGTVSFSIPRPERDQTRGYTDFVTDPRPNMLAEGGSITDLIGKHIQLDDTRKGFTLGTVSSVSDNHQSPWIEVTAISRLGELNVYNIQAQPFSGTLGNAFEYYLSLAGITYDFAVDPAVAVKPVVFPGWHGELWLHLKQLAAAVDCDVSLVSGIVILRPIRSRTATRGRDIDRSLSVGGGSLAQNVEVNQYNNRTISNQLVYPPGGWSEDVTTINVNAGESVEEILELSASVSSIIQPTMQTFVSREHDSSSVYTVVGDDGLPISPAAWFDNGGSLVVSINPDTTSLTVTITAPSGLPNANGEEIGVYGIALSSDDSTGRYSTLRIIGTGVAFDKEVVRIPTGISPTESATEVGVTIDNPFLSSRNDVYRTGLRAVRAYNGTALSLSGNVIAVNQLGDTGELVLTTYAEVQNALAPGTTYTMDQSTHSSRTYLQVMESYNQGTDTLFENQVFGNVNGARIWDKSTFRWYRIRTSTLNPDTIQFEAEDDLIYQDLQDLVDQTGATYAGMAQIYRRPYDGNTPLTYREVDLRGLSLGVMNPYG